MLYFIPHNEPHMSCIKLHSLVERFEVLMVVTQHFGFVARDAM